MDKTGNYTFMAEPFHCDFSGRLFMGHLGNHMLNAADFHSTDRGFGMQYLLTIKRSWVLSRLAIEMDDSTELVRTIDTYYSDVDINGHINSVKYIEHVLDLWDIAWYQQHAIKRFEIAYVAEAHQGDQLSLFMQQAGEQEYNVRICKTDPETKELIETCRSKVTFR